MRQGDVHGVAREVVVAGGYDGLIREAKERLLLLLEVVQVPRLAQVVRVGQDSVLGTCERDELLVRADGVGPGWNLPAYVPWLTSMAEVAMELAGDVGVLST